MDDENVTLRTSETPYLFCLASSSPPRLSTTAARIVIFKMRIGFLSEDISSSDMLGESDREEEVCPSPRVVMGRGCSARFVFGNHALHEMQRKRCYLSTLLPLRWLGVPLTRLLCSKRQADITENGCF